MRCVTWICALGTSRSFYKQVHFLFYLSSACLLAKMSRVLVKGDLRSPTLVADLITKAVAKPVAGDRGKSRRRRTNNAPL